METNGEVKKRPTSSPLRNFKFFQSNMRILVPRRAGFIGSHLVDPEWRMRKMRQHGIGTLVEDAPVTFKIRIARIFNPCGPRMNIDDRRVVSSFIAQALRGEALTVDGLIRLMEGEKLDQSASDPQREILILQITETALQALIPLCHHYSSHFGLPSSAIFTFSDDVHSQSNKSGRLTSNFNPNVEELEMLLEAYFAQIEGTVNFLKMKEYIDDTKDYINIMLEDKQNQILQMGLVLFCDLKRPTKGGLLAFNILLGYTEPDYIEENRSVLLE
ncbi:hypothetical protein C5167_036220 [Papaver somniferum]|nr:hypothetical protein C5167_036220 [Papaver somniferum]